MILKIRAKFKNLINQITTIRIDVGVKPLPQKNVLLHADNESRRIKQ